MLSVGFFRRLAFLTAFFAYLQIALGGVVRVSGSGLGCPDWPLCNGRPYPPPNVHSIIEYSHRTVGTITGVLLIATVITAWIVFRNRRPLVAWLATASLVAIESLLQIGSYPFLSIAIFALSIWIISGLVVYGEPEGPVDMPLARGTNKPTSPPTAFASLCGMRLCASATDGMAPDTATANMRTRNIG